MDPNFTWDFNDIYTSREEWEKAFAEAEELIAAIPAFEGTLGKSAASLKEALDTIYRATEKVERVYLYAFLHRSADGSNPDYQQMSMRVMSLAVKASTITSFVNPEILAIDEATLNEYMQAEGLATYKHFLEDVSRGRPHTLDAARERMLAQLGDVMQIPEECFSMLNDVDMTLPLIKDENGEDVQLTSGNFNVYRSSASRKVREDAFNAFMCEYKRYINTLSAMYSGAVKTDSFNASVRSFNSACEAAIFDSNVPVSVYDNLINSVHSALPAMRKYLDLRRKALGTDKIDMFDLYTPIVEDVEWKVTFEEAKTLVKEALAPLGEKYGELLDKAYAEKWMDVYENKGKTSGAFSCGVFGVHPYVLLNYTDTLDDAFTMAHELGHAMHSYLSDETQDFANHDYRILVAEVASTVNEVLLTLHLLGRETDPKRRAYVLNHFLESFRTTVFRQTLFAEFERDAHNMYDAGEPLTAQSLSDLYYRLISTYYEGIEINDIMRYEWSYIPHFYRNFYVYQYATGFSSAVAIANHIYETGDASGYLKFLSMGGSDYPLDELKTAGVDLTQPDAVDGAMKLFEKTIDELSAEMF